MFYNFLQTDFGTLTLIWSKNRLHALNFPSLTPTVLINNCKDKYGKLEKTFNANTTIDCRTIKTVYEES